MSNRAKYDTILKICVSLWAIGPAMVLWFALTGGRFWDGFAGSGHHNSELQDNLVYYSFRVAAAATIVTFIAALTFAVGAKDDKEQKHRFTVLALLSLIVPLAGVFGLLFAGLLFGLSS